MRTTSVVRPAHYPAMLDIAGQPVLLVGGGEVAARKAVALLAAGVRLRIVAPALSVSLEQRHANGEIEWQQRAARPDDVIGMALVVCAAGDAAANAAVAERARAEGIPVAVADDPDAGSFITPAVVRRGSLQVAISTGGANPALAAFVRRRVEETVGEEFGRLTELAEEMRERSRAAGLSAAERERITSAALPRLLELLRAGRDLEARQLATELATGAPPATQGTLSWS